MKGLNRKTVVLLSVFLSGLAVAAVRADPWSAIDSGFAVTTNHHGEEIIPPGDPPLAAKVGLLNTEFYFDNGTIRLLRVEVELRNPDEVVVDTEVVYAAEFLDDTSPQGNPIKYAWTADFEPSSWTVGHYSVKAYFYLKGARDLANAQDLDAMRAVSVMSVPELPVGTLTAVVLLVATLGLYSMLRNKRATIPFRTPSAS